MPANARLAILVMAAGSGERAGPGLPKQYRPILGVPVLRRTVETLMRAAPEAEIRVVISPEHRPAYDRAVEGLPLSEPVTGGKSRQESVRNGLEGLGSSDIVLIHDAARPFVSRPMLERLLGRLSAGDVQGVAPALPILDSIKRCDAEGVVSTSVDRSGLWRVQTPQAFRFEAILAAHRAAAGRDDATDDLGIAERAGHKVAVVTGEESAFKITTAEDFAAAEKHLLTALSDIRTGTGFDVHAFADGDHVMLCGVRIPHTKSLAGHSDADVGLHALTDAILGAIGAGDIGQHFPPSDPRWRGADSGQFLRHAASLLHDRGGVIAHADVTLICEAPKIAPHREAMMARIGELLGIPGRVSVKATTTEGLGFTGRREGIAAQAIATVRLP